MDMQSFEDPFGQKRESEDQQRQIFTVSRLNSEVRRLLESHFGNLWLVGEVSNFSAPSSGHWYFTLKDEQAQVRCAMFRGNNQRVRLAVNGRPNSQNMHGMQVLVRARLSLYEPRGDYQLIVEHLEAAGEGLLQQQFEALKQKLQHEGLFALERKKPLPKRVRKLGVITSPSGAAIKDVLSVLKRRDPSLEVIIYPAQVQGADAAGQLRQALATAIRRNEVDALLLTRGGGSLEDLWCFNDEALARDLAACPLPTISAVGHEVDFSICDFVADMRAATPSAAAELVSQDQQQLVRQLQQAEQQATRAMQQILQRQRTHLRHLRQRLQPLSPQQRLQMRAQQLDDWQQRAEQAMQRRLRQHQQQHEQLQHRLHRAQPGQSLPALRQRTEQLYNQGVRAITQQLNQALSRQHAAQQALDIVSPLQTLKRGYSITVNANGDIIRSATAFKPGDELRTRFAEGEIISEVRQVKP